ncbi:MAG: hypothetical protein ACM3ON_02735 [Chloroflexota bacterium]|jgi:hypothetical protein
MTKAAESSRKLTALARKWKAMEDQTIRSADLVLAKTTNPLVKTVMEMIKRDSEKHKLVLQMIGDSLSKDAPILTPDELKTVSALLNKHMEIESRSIELGTEAYRESRLLVPSYLLSLLLDDEMKHHRMIVQLTDELKKASIATSTGVRRPRK